MLQCGSLPECASLGICAPACESRVRSLACNPGRGRGPSAGMCRVGRRWSRWSHPSPDLLPLAGRCSRPTPWILVGLRGCVTVKSAAPCLEATLSRGQETIQTSATHGGIPEGPAGTACAICDGYPELLRDLTAHPPAPSTGSIPDPGCAHRRPGPGEGGSICHHPRDQGRECPPLPGTSGGRVQVAVLRQVRLMQSICVRGSGTVWRIPRNGPPRPSLPAPVSLPGPSPQPPSLTLAPSLPPLLPPLPM